MEYIIAIIGGGVGAAVISAISVLLSAWQKRKYEKEDKHDSVQEELAGVQSALNALSERIAQSEAMASRRDILRFDDELQAKMKHSKDYFRQILDDIDSYDEYCTAHPGFRNGYTTAAEAHIKEVYNKCLADGAFM